MRKVFDILETCSSDMDTTKVEHGTDTKSFRILSVIPGEAETASMVFAKRQVASLQKAGITNKTFFLSSRTSPIRIFKEWKRLRKQIRMFKPDLVHAHYGTMTAFLCVFSTRIPIVVTYRGNDLLRQYCISWLRSVTGIFLSQLAALRTKRIICVSNQLKRTLWWRRSRVTVIPSGVDTEIFYPRPRTEARFELGWEKEGQVVLFNAGDDPIRKGLDLAKSSIDVAKTICGEIRFIVLDGSVNPKLIPTLMNASNCVLSTSDSEGSPNIVKEAIACNVPVVSVDVGDVRERLDSVHPSRIVPRDPKEIGSALADIIMAGARSNGVETIQELSLERISIRILSVYQEALQR